MCIFPGFNAIAANLCEMVTLRGIAWLPLVTPSQLSSFEAFANASLGAQWEDASLAQLGYSNASQLSAGTAVVSQNVFSGVFAGSAANHTPVNASAPYYFPLLQQAPLHSNEAVIMFDLNSEPHRQRAISAVLADGLQHTTDFIHLVQDPDPFRIASLVITPVYFGGSIVCLLSALRRSYSTGILHWLPPFPPSSPVSTQCYRPI